jgi:hypothetical protein
MIATTSTQMLAELQANPTCQSTRLAAIDALMESTGKSRGSVVRTVNRIIRDELAVRAAEPQLAAANGRRRVRTLTTDDIRRAVRIARRDGMCAVGGDTVAKAYKYLASRTIALIVVRSDGSLRIAIAEGRANAGASITNPICRLTAVAKLPQFVGWADQTENI